jgi:hypothetical protein
VADQVVRRIRVLRQNEVPVELVSVIEALHVVESPQLLNGINKSLLLTDILFSRLFIDTLFYHIRWHVVRGFFLPINVK